MADCHKLIAQLADFVDGDLDPKLCRQLKAHLKGCRNCRIMLDRLTMTVKLCKQGECKDLPPELQEQLSNCLEDRWKRKFPAAGKGVQ